MPKQFVDVCLRGLILNLRYKFVWPALAHVVFWSLATLAMTTPNRTTTFSTQNNPARICMLVRTGYGVGVSMGGRNLEWFLRCGCAIVCVCALRAEFYFSHFCTCCGQGLCRCCQSVAIYSKYVGSPLLASCGSKT